MFNIMEITGCTVHNFIKPRKNRQRDIRSSGIVTNFTVKNGTNVT